MPKSKPTPTRQDRTKRAPRDPSADREKSWRPTDENFDESSDGTVDAEMEVDTDRYEAPRKDRSG